MKALLASLLIAYTTGVPAMTLSEEDEARAQALMREIRCGACENEPISQSAADIAENMRVQVRAQIAAGKSDAEVRDWFEERYGEFVLFRPKAEGPADWLLWGGPFLLLAVGAGLAFMLTRKRAAREPVEPVAPEDLPG